MPKTKSVNPLSHLSKDPVMAKLVKAHQLSEWPQPRYSQQYLFAELGETILGQQLSGKAADTIIGRFKELFLNSDETKKTSHRTRQEDKKNYFPTPEQVLEMPDEKIRTCGTSWAKIKYIKNIANAILSKELDTEKLPVMSDNDVRQLLLKIKGIGPWTTEMILMFTLRRPDIFSPGDVGLQNAICKFYGVKRGNIKKMIKISLQWSPHRTLACRYLWRGIDTK